MGGYPSSSHHEFRKAFLRGPIMKTICTNIVMTGFVNPGAAAAAGVAWRMSIEKPVAESLLDRAEKKA